MRSSSHPCLRRTPASVCLAHFAQVSGESLNTQLAVRRKIVLSHFWDTVGADMMCHRPRVVILKFWHLTAKCLHMHDLRLLKGLV